MKSNFNFVNSKTKNYCNQKTSSSSVNCYRFEESCQINEDHRLNNDKIKMTKARIIS